MQQPYADTIRQAAILRLAGYPSEAMRLCRQGGCGGQEALEREAIYAQSRADLTKDRQHIFDILSGLSERGLGGARLLCFQALCHPERISDAAARALLDQARQSAGSDPYLLAEVGYAHLARQEIVWARDVLLKAAAIACDSATIHALLAKAHYLSGDDRNAHASARRAWRINSRAAHTARMLLPTALCAGDERDAALCLDWLDDQPPWVSLSMMADWSDLLEARRRYFQASEIFRPIVEANPDSFADNARMGELLLKAYKPEEAIEYLTAARARKPHHPGVLSLLGRCFIQTGDLEQAKAVLRQSRDANPHQIVAYSLLTEIDPRTMDESDAEALAACIQGASWDSETLATGLIALARYKESKGRYGPAFEDFRRAKTLLKQTNQHKGLQYDPAEQEREFADIRTIFTAERMAGHRRDDDRGKTFVFIVGMPRSGTTLTDQILSSHPKIAAIPEQSIFHEIWQGIRAAWRAGAELWDYIESNLPLWRERYERIIGAGSIAEDIIIDKLPLNFQYVGLISLIYPSAKIIHARRNPVDNCLSIYRLRFPETFTFANDLDDLAHFYRLQSELMGYWRSVCGCEIRESHYEDLILDTERSARALVAFTGAQWDPACMDFYRSDRPVFTLSGTQVRRPIYRSAINRGRRFLDALPPSILALEELSGSARSQPLRKIV